MLEIDGFSRAVSQIYDASLSVERWDDALATLASLFESPKAQISYFASSQDASPFFRFCGVDEAALGPTFLRYRDLAIADPRRPPRFFKAYHCRQLISDEALRATAMYQQVLAPAQIEYALYFALELDDDAGCAVGVMRGPDQTPFTAEDCEDFGRFIPHISRAVSLHGTLRRARDTLAAAKALIDGVPLGMLVIQDDVVLLANAGARALLDRGDPLRCIGGRLEALTSQSSAKLRQAMLEALDSPGDPVGVTFAARDTAQVRALVRRLQPATAGMLGARGDAVALYLADSRQPVETSQEVLRRLFGLTDREASVLQAAIDGEDNRGIARRLGIGVETVKTHLSHIMQIAGVGRRSELVKLVLSSPAWLRAPDAEPPNSI